MGQVFVKTDDGKLTHSSLTLLIKQLQNMLVIGTKCCKFSELLFIIIDWFGDVSYVAKLSMVCEQCAEAYTL